MRKEISNELLLQVIQAWDPSETDSWGTSNEDLMWDYYFIREANGRICTHVEGDPWDRVSKLVEFLLKDRPDLGDPEADRWPYLECKKACNGFWTLDPWESTTTSDHMVRRIKSYEYLKAWKEEREKSPSAFSLECQADEIEARLAREEKICNEKFYIERPVHIYPGQEILGCNITTPESYKWDFWWMPFKTPEVPATPTPIDPNDVVLSICGQTIEGIEICDDILGVPATYEQLCPYCNGSKEVTGWHGKELCQACD